MRGIAVSPAAQDPVELLRLAHEHRDARRLPEAELLCRQTIELLPHESEPYRVLGTILQLAGRGAAALAAFEQAVRLRPESPRALQGLAVALAEEGRLSEAVEADRRALELSPRYIAPLQHLAQLKTFSRGDPDLARLEKLAAEEDSLGERQLIGLFFALAKAYDDVGEYERSFEYLCRANALKRGRIDYDVDEDVRILDRTAEIFSPELFERFAGAGWRSELPILIVGMPRSGTTLVEQILASHPGVHGGGELRDLEEIVAAVSLLNEAGLALPEGIVHLRPPDISRLGQAYVERLSRLAPDAHRVTDKQPLNFRHLGLVRLIAPRARVIHCVRDPVDTCLSCFRLPFEAVEFAFDLSELARYYRAYARLMRHWRTVIPNWLLEVSYEDLVEDVETQARRIVAYCGLEWDSRCLDFHATERTIRTASYAQVRKPIYREAVHRWQRYGSTLEPLIDALGLDQPG